MPDEEISLAHQIRKKVDAGLLPRVLTDKMLTGYGHIGPCDGCDQPIYPPQVEYKFAINPDSGRLFRLHIGCVGMWRAELRRRAVLRVLRSHPGQKYCTPCLANAAGIADAREVRRLMDRANELLDLRVVQDGCDTCHTVRRTLAAS
jgi:hypothetical protein